MRSLIAIRSAATAIWLLAAGISPDPAAAQQGPVTARVEIKKDGAARKRPSSESASVSGVVVWLRPLDRELGKSGLAEHSGPRPRLVQRDKSFQPHLLVVPVGSVVDFPNHDPFFHNVFSLFDGKRFDLGLYEAGATNVVRFDRVGVSFLFCNIHPEMSAVVVAVDTPFYGVSDRSGNLSMANVPEGKYELHVWYERGLPDDLKALTRTVTLSQQLRDLGTIVVRENPNFSPAHQNKYGQDYVPPPPQGYPHP